MIDWSYAHHIDSAFEASKMTAKHYTVLAAPEQMLEGPWLHNWLRLLEVWGHPALPRGHAAAILVARGSCPGDAQLWAFVQPQHRRNTIYRAKPVLGPVTGDMLWAAPGQRTVAVEKPQLPPPQGKSKAAVLVGLRSEDAACVALMGELVVRVVKGPVDWGRRGGNVEGAARLAEWMLKYSGYEGTTEEVRAVSQSVVRGLTPEFEESWSRLERRVSLAVGGLRKMMEAVGDEERVLVVAAMSAAFSDGGGAWGCEVMVAGERTTLGAGGHGVRESNAGVMALLNLLQWVEREVGPRCHLCVTVEAAGVVDDVLVRLPKWAASGFVDASDSRKWREVDRRLGGHRSEWRVDRDEPGVLAARAYACAVLQDLKTFVPEGGQQKQPVPAG